MTVLESAPSTVVGIDVSKATLVVFDPSHHRLMSIDNNRASIAKLIASFDPNTLVVCEPTGGHEAALVSELMAQGIACHRADTLKVQAFIKSFGRLAKTDAIDARALAQYGADRWKQLPLFKPKDEAQNQLAALVARREDLMAIKIAETNRMKAPGKNKTLARSLSVSNLVDWSWEGWLLPSQVGRRPYDPRYLAVRSKHGSRSTFQLIPNGCSRKSA